MQQLPFLKYFKSRLFPYAGGSPPLHPPPLRGGPAYRPGDQQNSWGQYETEPIKKQRLMGGQRMKQEENVSFRLKTLCLGQKNSEKNICFPLKKLFFLPSVEKTTIFSSGNKSSPQSFSVPGIMFPPRRNIYRTENKRKGTLKSFHIRFLIPFYINLGIAVYSRKIINVSI